MNLNSLDGSSSPTDDSQQSCHVSVYCVPLSIDDMCSRREATDRGRDDGTIKVLSVSTRTVVFDMGARRPGLL